MEEVTVPGGPEGMMIGSLLKAAGLASSTGEAMRLIRQGAVRVDGERVTDPRAQCPHGETHAYQVGKRRWARVTVG